jgi:hypothetical protein
MRRGRRAAFGRGLAAAFLLALQAAPALRAEPAPDRPAPSRGVAGGGETIEQALCRLVERSADVQHLPIGFFTRLIWQESSFHPRAISPAGAQGIAQFMPGTAQERGLADPFDPEQAIPASAALLGDLVRRFGNIGLAAAAYNGGPTRVTAWLQGTGHLPFETSDYVLRITGREAEDWAADAAPKTVPDSAAAVAAGPLTKPAPSAAPSALAAPAQGCLAIVADLRRLHGSGDVAEAPFAPWGVQLAGNFSKRVALAAFARARARYQTVIGEIRPMIIGTRLRSRGTRAFYRVRVPAATREEAANLCVKIHALRGACIVLRS